MSEKLERLGELPFWEWPHDGTATVHAALSSDSVDERALAAEVAYHAMSDAMAEGLVTMLQAEKDEHAASTAARSLGAALEACDADEEDADAADAPLTETCFESTLSALQAIYGDSARPAAIRRAALEAAAHAPRPWVVQAIEQAFGDADIDGKVCALFCMSIVRGFEKQLLAALESDVPRVRGQAMYSAAVRSVPAAAPRILAAAADADETRELRVVAVDALAHLAGDEAAELLSRLSRDSDATIAERASLSLEERAEAQMAADLHRVLEDE
ncbi:MAG: hypothetical protein KC503_42595 [Myxococcales bacterium]|nr:hypothetical protein [Myxococcales bacterium]